MVYKKVITIVVLWMFSNILYAQEWSWQKKNAEVLQTGDLAWKPEMFVYNPGQNIRYIDFENGNDQNSGTVDQPIQLTVDPSWGKGEAMIYGSEQIKGGWKKADEKTAPNFPDPEKIWYIDVGTSFTPRLVWETRTHMVNRIPIAREPDWKISNPEDIKSEWYEWEGSEVKEVTMESNTSSRIIAHETVKI